MNRREVCNQIFKYYLFKYDNDVSKALNEVSRLYITNLFYTSENNVTIILKRPGILIGKRGENIDNLQQFTKWNMNIIEDTNEDIFDIFVNLSYDYRPMQETE